MQANDNTRLNPAAIDAKDFDRADDLMKAMADAGFSGMTSHQRNLVCKMGEMLDAAVARLDAIHARAGFSVGVLTAKAANHALSMRMHGATLRGIPGAELLEDLCDAVLGRYVSENASAPKTPKPVLVPDPVPPGCLTVEEAMTMLGINRFAQLARSIGTSPSMITLWRNQGYLPPKKTKIMRDLASGVTQEAA